MLRRITLLALLIAACSSPTEPSPTHDWCVWHGTGPDACRPLPR